MAVRPPHRLVEEFGQLFMMAVDGKRPPPEVLEFLATFRIGGVILFEDNSESPAQLRSLVDLLQRRCARPGKPLFIAVDQEGGAVQRFREGFSPIPSAAELGERAPSDTEEVAWRAAGELRAVGVNLNLAPVADLCPHERPGAIGPRSFGPDPARTAAHVEASVHGHHRAGLLACVKHFPGHGATSTDSRKTLPVIDRSLPQLEAEDLIPFQAAIAAGVDVVMTAHAVYAGSDDADRPASLSPYWCTGVLRERLGFDGVVLTDALEMKALSHLSPADSGAMALAAGADILLYYREGQQFTAFAELRDRLEQGDLDPARVEASLRRVQSLRSRIALP